MPYVNLPDYSYRTKVFCDRTIHLITDDAKSSTTPPVTSAGLAVIRDIERRLKTSLIGEIILCRDSNYDWNGLIWDGEIILLMPIQEKDEAVAIEKAGNQVVSIFTVYARPQDFPCDYVLREHRQFPGFATTIPLPSAFVRKSLEEVRKGVPAHCVRFLRSPKDDPVIVESWI